ncbi:MAG: ComEA family DNA-binding protein [Thermodesulfobacteriota bacterium]
MTKINRHTKREQRLVIFFGALFLILSYFIHKTNTLGSDNSLIVYKENGGTYIEVLGEVRAPGIYNFNEGVTVCDAVKRAGGLRHSLSIDTSLQSTILKRGEKVTVQRISERRGKVLIERMEPQKLMVFSIPLDINTASQQELLAVPGIGIKTALNIIEYRDKNNGFSTIEELKNVKGIGNVRYERIKSYLRAG